MRKICFISPVNYLVHGIIYPIRVIMNHFNILINLTLYCALFGNFNKYNALINRKDLIYPNTPINFTDINIFNLIINSEKLNLSIENSYGSLSNSIDFSTLIELHEN